MSADFKMTAEEFKNFESQVKNVFDIVRVLDENLLEQVSVGENGEISCVPCECYSFWKKGQRCENCISAKVLAEKGQRTKLEVLGDQVYQVFSKYAEIEGKPCAIEMLSVMQEDSMVDSHGRDELLKMLSEYKRELYTDALTGAYNRRYYEECIKDKILDAGTAMIDIDCFKDCNDTFGHDAGDMVLKRVVEIAQGHIRKTDMLIRMGGDEFALLLLNADKESFQAKLEEIRQDVEKMKVLGYRELKSTLSIGSVIAGKDESVEEALHRADALLYQAKKTRNMVVQG